MVRTTDTDKLLVFWFIFIK